MRSDISTVTLSIRPVSCTSGQLKSPLWSPSPCTPHCSAFPFICDLYSQRSSLLLSIFIFYNLCHILFFYSLFCFVYLSSSYCSVGPPALLAPLLFVLVINCCLQADNEVLVCLVAGVCFRVWVHVFIAHYAHIATAEDNPESSRPILKHTHAHSPLTCGQACALQQRVTLIN